MIDDKRKKQIRKQISIVPPNAANKLIPKVFFRVYSKPLFPLLLWITFRDKGERNFSETTPLKTEAADP